MKKVWTLLALLLALSGCQTQGPEAQQDQPHDGVRVQQTTPQASENKKQLAENQSAQDIAERLVKLAVKVPDVNDATAVVFGRVAFVGIDVPAKYDRSRVGTIKYSVAEALTEDPFGANAIVTADTDTVQRIREIAADLRRGRPIAGFAEELADMAGRLMPQLPHHVETRDSEGNEAPKMKSPASNKDTP